MESSTFWEDSSSSLHRRVKFESSNNSSKDRDTVRTCKEEQSVFRCCEGNLNFATIATSEDDDYGSYQKKKVSRDPMSHRIIEKRRRDRMNNCLADLSRLIPADYLKKGRGRIEKTEIIEMAIKHMKHLQAHACHQLETCELAQQQCQEDNREQHPAGGPIVTEHYRLGYQECLSEAMHFLVEVEGFFAGDPFCVQLINHLQKHCEKILKGDRLNFPRAHNGETASTSSNSSGSNHHSSILQSASSGLNSVSPTSGSCSDTGRTDNKDSSISNGIPDTQNQCVAALPSLDVGEDACFDDGLVNLNGPSQLREMLTNSNISSHHTNQTTTTVPRTSQTPTMTQQHLYPPPSPVQTLAGSQFSSGVANGEQNCPGGSAASLYKFKNNIKQRFTAEHHIDESNGEDLSVSNANSEHNTDKNNVTFSTMTNFKRRDSETCSIPSSPPTPPPHSKYPQPSPSPDIAHSPPLLPVKSLSNPHYGVPIFALHAKGSFYIPLTLDSEILAPYLAAIGFDINALQNGNTDNVVLHPVTISVNFHQINNHRIHLHHNHISRQHTSLYMVLFAGRKLCGQRIRFCTYSRTLLRVKEENNPSSIFHREGLNLASWSSSLHAYTAE
ncbi:hypothetical protein L9F63_018986, partial [Diploptera punctata]